MGIKHHTAKPIQSSSEACRVKYELAQDEVSLESLIQNEHCWLVDPDTIHGSGENKGAFVGVSLSLPTRRWVFATWII